MGQLNAKQNEINKAKDDILLRDEHYEKMSGSYDRLEREYQILKKQYVDLEKSKNITNDNTNNTNNYDTKKRRKKRKKNASWSDEESDNDDITKSEKKAIKKWIKLRHESIDKKKGK